MDADAEQPTPTKTDETKDEDDYVLGNAGPSSDESAMAGSAIDEKESVAATMEKQKKVVWDPFVAKSQETGEPTQACIKRVKTDILKLYNDPVPAICVWVDDADIRVVHALISGPFDTPYEGGFFYFLARAPNDYPNQPPTVKLMTTSSGRVRFNPNLYADGKVCLSILGTWSGPSWTPVLSFSSVLMSIQSLMTEYPYYNEPGFETERHAGDADTYNHILRHETLRAAVCEMLEEDSPSHKQVPAQLRQLMEGIFETQWDYYTQTIEENIHRDGQPMIDPFTQRQVGVYRYADLRRRLNAIKDRIGFEADDEV